MASPSSSFRCVSYEWYMVDFFLNLSENLCLLVGKFNILFFIYFDYWPIWTYFYYLHCVFSLPPFNFDFFSSSLLSIRLISFSNLFSLFSLLEVCCLPRFGIKNLKVPCEKLKLPDFHTTFPAGGRAGLFHLPFHGRIALQRSSSKDISGVPRVCVSGSLGRSFMQLLNLNRESGQEAG